MSNDLGNSNSPILNISPIIDAFKKSNVLPTHIVYTNDFKKKKIILLEQTRVIDKTRVLKRVERISFNYHKMIDDALFITYKPKLNKVPFTEKYCQGSILWANLSPTMGSEQKGERSVLVISNDVGNRASSVVSVIPLSKRVNKESLRDFPLHLILSTMLGDRVALLEQTRVIDKSRLTKKLGSLSDSQIQYVYENLLKIYVL